MAPHRLSPIGKDAVNRFRTLIYALVVAGALAAGPAASPGWGDHGVPYQDATFDRYVQIAQAHWAGTAPTCRGPAGETIPVHAILFDDADPDIAAIAEQPGCRIWLDRDFWPAREDQTDCTIIAHEWGHLLGHDHSPNERSLMYEAPEFGAPGCGVFASVLALSVAQHRTSAGTSPRRCVRRNRAGRPARRAKRGRARCNRRTRARAIRHR